MPSAPNPSHSNALRVSGAREKDSLSRESQRWPLQDHPAEVAVRAHDSKADSNLKNSLCTLHTARVQCTHDNHQSTEGMGVYGMRSGVEEGQGEADRVSAVFNGWQG